MEPQCWENCGGSLTEMILFNGLPGHEKSYVRDKRAGGGNFCKKISRDK